MTSDLVKVRVDIHSCFVYCLPTVPAPFPLPKRQIQWTFHKTLGSPNNSSVSEFNLRTKKKPLLALEYIFTFFSLSHQKPKYP